MMWPGGHQYSQNGWSASRDEHRLEAPRAVAVGAEDLELVQPLHVEGERALRAVDLPLERVAAAVREARRLERADRAVRELDRGLDRVVDLAARQERVREAGDGLDLAVEEAREVDDVRHQVAERAGAGRVGVEAPRVERRVVAPVLEVAAAEVADLAELARLDHLPREPHRRDEAVVEGAHVLHAGRGHRLPDLVALVRVAAERLLADDVLARLAPPRSSARRAASSGRRCRTARSARRRRARASRSSRTPSRSAAPPRRRPPRSGRRSRRASARAAAAT